MMRPREAWLYVVCILALIGTAALQFLGILSTEQSMEIFILVFGGFIGFNYRILRRMEAKIEQKTG